MEELRKILRQFLNEKDMSLEKASLYFGCSISALSKFLKDKNKCDPNDRTLYKIRKGLALTKK